MNAQAFTTLFAILAIACNVTVLGIGALWLAARFSDGAAGLWEDARDSLGDWSVGLAWLIALVATLGSLYYSERVGFIPCTLCWYQRIAMYPLALILGIAAVRRDRGIRIYAIPMAAIGAVLSLYHYLVQQFPDLETGTCSTTVPCSAKWVERFGFVSIPYMALSAFLAIMVLLAIWPRHQDDDRDEDAAPEGAEIAA